MTSELARTRISATTLGDLLLTAADRYPDTCGIVLPDCRFTYAELSARALDRARALRAIGVGAGDHVGILLPTCIDFVDTLFAVALLGAVCVPINARYRAPEIAYVVDNADLVALVTNRQFAESVDFVARLHAAFPDLAAAPDALHLALAAAPKLRCVLLCDDPAAPGMVARSRLDDLGRGVTDDEVHLRRLQARLGATALIIYTSGTTSHPKGCMLTHESIVRNGIELGRRYELGPADRFWSPLPMFHIAAILPMVTIFGVGGTYVTTNRFDAGEALRMLQSEAVTATYPCFWTIMSDLVSHPDFPAAELSRVRLMNANFAVQPAEIAEKMARAMPDTVYVGSFGMTEASGTVCTSRLTDTRAQRFGRLGTPLPGMEVRIVDPDTGAEVAPGMPGECLIRGYSTFTAYYKSPQKTAEALDAAQWFHSGDRCSIDADGQILFHGRLKDMLKVGGENVAAAEIEACLQQHPAVRLAQVVGVPDARLAEVPAAFVELQPGARASAPELIDHCRDRVAGFKVPRHVRFVSEWPTSSTKIQKFKLREQLLAELEAAAGNAARA